MQSPNAADSKRSISVCAMPKSNCVEVPKTDAEQRREKQAEAHNKFLNELGVLIEVLNNDRNNNNADQPLEKRILLAVEMLKDKWMQVQEERDVLRNNNHELESKFRQLLKGW